ncbi:MAG TPA: GNAT family N-acetyltransferase [Vitreimonas sp.]|nr:GNAT family N-acetyltransferase [Vitreimonas sp.]
MLTRLLTAQDGAEYQRLRLQSLVAEPDSFLSDISSEEGKHESSFALELDYAYHPPYFGFFGSFQDEKLLAYCQVQRSFTDKQMHIAFLYNLYVDKGYRGQGYGRGLMNHVLELLNSHEHIERIFLSCNSKNKYGLQFYKKMGFHRCGIRPRSIKWHGVYDDEIEMVKVL